MITRIPPAPWRTAWRIAAGSSVLAILLLSVAVGLVLAAWLPQMPAGVPAEPVAYARWLSETQARFGEATGTLQSLGLFTIVRTLGFRIAVMLLAACLLLHLVESVDRLRREGRAALAGVLSHAGALLLLAGLLVTHLWSRQVEGQVARGGERVTLPDSDKWVALDEDARGATHSPGVVAVVEEAVAGVQINATDPAGQRLGFQRSPEDELVQLPTAVLDEDQFFAIPEAGLVIRLAAQSGSGDEHGPMLVQVYRSPPGQLAVESAIDGDGNLVVGDVTLQFVSVPHARLTAVANPGSWPTGVGILVFVAGLLASVSLRTRAERGAGNGQGN